MRTAMLRIMSLIYMNKQLHIAVYVLFVAKLTHEMGSMLTRPVSIFEMKRFMNTSERMWVVRTTNPANVSCLYDVKRLINREFIIYNRTFSVGRRRFSVPLRGVFDVGEPDRMIAATLDRHPYSVERLLYANWNYSCGVVRVVALNRVQTTTSPSPAVIRSAQ
uniref:Lipocalin n=1 Tax=Rhipicephalus appendiculatus TaxID=34631 RepID=A0A131Z040_RHIAP